MSYPSAFTKAHATRFLTARAVTDGELHKRNAKVTSKHRITIPAAQLMASYPGYIPLWALEYLSAPAAKALAKHQGEILNLAGLRNLETGVAMALSTFQGTLCLDWVEELSDEDAEALSAHRGPSLHLCGLTMLSDRAAASLSNHQGQLWLTGLSEDAEKVNSPIRLSKAAAASLSKHKGLQLDFSTLGPEPACFSAPLTHRKLIP